MGSITVSRKSVSGETLTALNRHFPTRADRIMPLEGRWDDDITTSMILGLPYSDTCVTDAILEVVEHDQADGVDPKGVAVDWHHFIGLLAEGTISADQLASAEVNGERTRKILRIADVTFRAADGFEATLTVESAQAYPRLEEANGGKGYSFITLDKEDQFIL